MRVKEEFQVQREVPLERADHCLIEEEVKEAEQAKERGEKNQKEGLAQEREPTTRILWSEGELWKGIPTVEAAAMLGVGQRITITQEVVKIKRKTEVAVIDGHALLQVAVLARNCQRTEDEKAAENVTEVDE